MIKTITLMLCFLLALGHGEEKPRSLLEVLQPPGDFPRIKKREEEIDYFEQCQFVDVLRKRLGHVNVFAFLDSSWQYSYRQAIMLKSLQKQLENSGFWDIWFFVVGAPPDLPEDKAEDDIEVEVWREISVIESENILNSMEKLIDDLIRNPEADVVFIQDTADLKIWERFRASKDQIVIIDRCGRLTYQVIVPWSILYFPYVKAAILSTYKEDLCGPCDVQSAALNETINYENISEKNNGIQTVREETESVNTENEEYMTTDIFATESVTITNVDGREFNESFIFDNAENNKFEATTGSYALDETTVMPAKKMYTERIDVFAENDENGETHTLLDEPDDKVKNESVQIPLISVVLANRLPNDVKRIRDFPENRIELKENDISVPMRIIMRAPHFHRQGNLFKKHKYLILKTGSPEYHGHFGSGEYAIPDWQEKPNRSENLKTDKEHQKHKSEYNFDKDESPGLYGEVADYWINYAEVEIIDRNETTDTDYNNFAMTTGRDGYHVNLSDQTIDTSFTKTGDHSMKQGKTDTKNHIDNSKDIVQLKKISFIKNISNVNVDSNEEETKNRLIAHYSKLLPWIYYVLNK